MSTTNPPTTIEAPAPKQSRVWLIVVALIGLQLAVWTVWLIIASHHPVAEVPLAPKVGKSPRSKLRGIAETDIWGPGSARVPRAGLGVPSKPSEPLSAGRREQHARRVRSPNQRNRAEARFGVSTHRE